MDANNLWWKRAFILFFAVCASVGVWTAPDYGLSWDFGYHDRYGRLVYSWYSAPSFTHPAITDAMRLYGPCFELIVNAVRSLLPGIDDCNLKNSVTFLVGLSSSIACYLMATRVSSRRAGFIAGVTLMLIPMFYGHSFMNHKDLPFAVAYTWVLAGLGMLIGSPRVAAKKWFFIGFLFGVCLAVRVAGIMLLPMVGLAWLYGTFSDGSRARFNLRVIGRNALGLGYLLVTTAISTMCLWPFVFANPIAGIQEALKTSAAFPFIRTVLFEGQQIPARELPARYLFVWFELTLPEFVLLGLTLASISGVWLLVSRGFSLWSRATGQMIITICGAVVPVAAIIAARSTLYDGVRHLLFIVPSLAVISALGFDFFLRKLPAWGSKMLGLTLIAGATVVVVDLVHLHPYEYIYFNRLFAGGLRGISGKFETEYWATCMKEGVEWVQRNRSSLAPLPITVGGFATPPQIGTYIQDPTRKVDGIFFAELEPECDIFITTTRWDGHIKPYKKLHTIDRQGVPLCYIFDTRPRAPKAPQ